MFFIKIIYIIIPIVLVTAFICWQLHVCLKYINQCSIKIDVSNRVIAINKNKFRFREISQITVSDSTEQPNFAEKILSKSAFNVSISTVEFYMKDGSVYTCVCNTSGQVYDILTKLQPYIKVNADIEMYKPKFNKLLFLCLILGFFLYMLTRIPCFRIF